MQDTATQIAGALPALGAGIRARRKQLRVSATAAAEAAGLSRVTLHRIERAHPPWPMACTSALSPHWG